MDESELTPCLVVASHAAALRFPTPSDDDADALALAVGWQQWALETLGKQLNGYVYDRKVAVFIDKKQVLNYSDAFRTPQEKWTVDRAGRERLLHLFNEDPATVRPVFDVPVRPEVIPPLLRLLPESASILMRWKWRRNGEGTATPTDAIKHFEEAMLRQAEGWFTVLEAAQVLADARPGVDPTDARKRFVLAHTKGELRIHQSESHFPLEPGETVDDYCDQLRVTELDSWLRASTGYGFPTADGAPAPVPAVRAAIPEEILPARARRVKPPQVFREQEAEILKAIHGLGYDPKRLPPRRAGAPWVKSAVWQAIGVCPLFVSEGVFKKAWDRLRGLTEIAERHGL